MDAKQKTEIPKPIKKLGDNWGAMLSLAGAVGYGLTIFADQASSKTSSVAVLLAGVGAVQWFVQRNRKDTREAVDDALTFESMMAGMGIKERLDSLENHQNEKHKENKEAHAAMLAALTKYQAENDRLHAEHISVTDSLAAGLSAVGGVVAELRPGFELPAIVERQRAGAA